MHIPEIDVLESRRSRQLIEKTGELSFFARVDRLTSEYDLAVQAGIALLAAMVGVAILLTRSEASQLLVWVTGLMCFCAALFAWAVHKVRKDRELVRIRTGLDLQRNRECAQSAVLALQWRVVVGTADYLRAMAKKRFNTDQDITVIYDHGELLFNSRNCIDDGDRTPFSFGRNAENLELFLGALQAEMQMRRTHARALNL